MLKILHVDDNRLDLDLISVRLNRLAVDLDIAQVESAAAALQRIEEGSYDCTVSLSASGGTILRLELHQ